MDSITFRKYFSNVLTEALNTYNKCPGALQYASHIFDYEDDIHTENECRKVYNLGPSGAFWSIKLDERSNPYSEVNIDLINGVLEVDFTYTRYEDKKKVAMVEREYFRKILIHLNDFTVPEGTDPSSTILLIINRILRFHREFMSAMQYNDYELWTNVNPIL